MLNQTKAWKCHDALKTTPSRLTKVPNQAGLRLSNGFESLREHAEASFEKGIRIYLSAIDKVIRSECPAWPAIMPIGKDLERPSTTVSTNASPPGIGCGLARMSTSPPIWRNSNRCPLQ